MRQRVRIAPGDDDVRTFLLEQNGAGQADAARAAGDEGDLTV
jgi:hypothetical protein